jgi:hypothetical protein
VAEPSVKAIRVLALGGFPMSSQSDGVVDDATKTAPKQGEEKQSNSLEARLIALAKESGQIQDDIKPSDSVEVQEIPEVAEQPPEDEPEKEPDEPEPEEIAAEKEEEKEAEDEESEPDKLKKLVPLGNVIEERHKKQQAQELADKAKSELVQAQSRIAELEAALSQSSGPMPTPDNPLIDIQDDRALNRLERVYEKLEEIDLDQRNEDDTITVPVDIGRDGKFIYRKVAPEEAKLAQKRADRVLRKDIPRRREYLTQRAQIDAQTNELYPDLKDTSHEFTKLVNDLTNRVINGLATNSPDVRTWAAHAVYGAIKRGEELKAAQAGKNGESPVKQIVEASKQKIAPTTPRTRATVERRSGADIAKATKELEQNPDSEEARLAYIAAVRSNRGGQRKALQPTD